MRKDDEEEFFDKLLPYNWSWSDANLECRDELFKAILPKLEDWFEEEVHNAYDYSKGISALHNLHWDLKYSKVAEAISLFVFNSSYGYLCGLWDERRFLKPEELYWDDWEENCRTELDRLEGFVINCLLPKMKLNSLKELLKALNKWELETKMNLKLDSLEKDFQ